MDWKSQLSQRITQPENLPPGFTLSQKEKAFFAGYKKGETLPFSVTPYYLSLIDPFDPDDPVRKQCIPTENEFHIKEYEDADPLYERDYEPVPSLVHRYGNRVLLRATGLCAAYCRHCFRRFITGKWMGRIEGEKLSNIVDYISRHPEIDEVLISGGDPFILDDDVLLSLVRAIRNIRKRLIIRLCTRTPVVLPQRITPSFVDSFAALHPVWVVTQFNHPNEITGQSEEAVKRITSKGIPVLNQTVLLKGINDSPSILCTLFRGLTAILVKPYYLFQGDLACGTSHFRVSLKKGIKIYEDIRKILSGIALPKYTLDLPNGGGKIFLSASCLHDFESGWYRIKNYEGKVCKYPEEDV